VTSKARSYAVVDLGSNSFHMVIAQEDGDLRIVDKLREPVRMADGLDGDGYLSDAAQERALQCLERFAQRVRELPAPHVRIVGTNTLRQARNGRAFRVRAAQILGHPIEIVSGDEEARLIYLGVAHLRSDPGRRRLVVDIGGGSTELVVGQDFEVLRAHSLFLGCVGLTKRYFAEGRFSHKALRAADTTALLEVRAIRHRLLETGFEVAIGCSGSVLAVSEILAANGWSDGRVTSDGLRKLSKHIEKAGRVADLDLPGLREDRRPVLAAGVAILRAIFIELQLSTLDPSPGALREGVLYELVGRDHEQDVRDATIARLADRYGVDRAQATRVAKMALDLARQLDFPSNQPGFDVLRYLQWAAQLHEIGHALSYTGHHRHGAYIVRNSHLPGFSRDDQVLLSLLLQGQRRRVRREIFAELSDPHESWAIRLCVVLRLAVLLNRSRSLAQSPACSGDLRAGKLKLRFPAGWFAEHPLTADDLHEERRFLRSLGVELSYSDE
jgi:exopolyphosphatase/guanosine-5'-triphosphate,3'-diphosphate pyrophosphatase